LVTRASTHVGSHQATFTPCCSQSEASNNKHCFEHQFNTDDLVFLKLQSYVQSSLAPSANHKLAFKYFGPSMVLERIGVVTYKVNLLSTTIHLVFHVSQLKKEVGVDSLISSSLPTDLSAWQVLEIVLQCRMVSRGVGSVL
jgi:hypothetical protein